MRELERQGAGMARLAHLFATLMVVLFSLGSLVALSGDAFGAIVNAIEHGGLPGIPQAISVLVSTLMVVCCDIGLVYAAMTLRVLKTRGTSRDEQLLHWFVLVTVATIEAGSSGSPVASRTRVAQSRQRAGSILFSIILLVQRFSSGVL